MDEPRSRTSPAGKRPPERNPFLREQPLPLLREQAEVLRQAAEFPPAQWQPWGYAAQNQEEEWVSPRAPDAVYYGAAAILERCHLATKTAHHEAVALHALQLSYDTGRFEELCSWSRAPGRTPEEVKAVFLKAAALLERVADDLQAEFGSAAEPIPPWPPNYAPPQPQTPAPTATARPRFE